MGAPVICHPDEVPDAESDELFSPYMKISQLPFAPVRWLYPLLFRRWDGGPVRIRGNDRRG
jgi:hypothetical protein